MRRRRYPTANISYDLTTGEAPNPLRVGQKYAFVSALAVFTVHYTPHVWMIVDESL